MFVCFSISREFIVVGSESRGERDGGEVRGRVGSGGVKVVFVGYCVDLSFFLSDIENFWMVLSRVVI